MSEYEKCLEAVRESVRTSGAGDCSMQAGSRVLNAPASYDPGQVLLPGTGADLSGETLPGTPVPMDAVNLAGLLLVFAVLIGAVAMALRSARH